MALRKDIEKQNATRFTKLLLVAFDKLLLKKMKSETTGTVGKQSCDMKLFSSPTSLRQFWDILGKTKSNEDPTSWQCPVQWWENISMCGTSQIIKVVFIKILQVMKRLRKKRWKPWISHGNIISLIYLEADLGNYKDRFQKEFCVRLPGVK